MEEEMAATSEMSPAVAAEQLGFESPWSYLGSGFLAWLLQRITAIGLVVLLPIHIVINHLANISKVEQGLLPGLVVFSNVAKHFESPAYWTVDVLLLSFALYHGLNGVRNVAVDYGLRGWFAKAFTGALVGVGAAAFAFGIVALAAFID
jgi:succinate dehydrogenase / fumarate reductase membrane anchor subunit